MWEEEGLEILGIVGLGFQKGRSWVQGFGRVSGFEVCKDMSHTSFQNDL